MLYSFYDETPKNTHEISITFFLLLSDIASCHTGHTPRTKMTYVPNERNQLLEDHIVAPFTTY